MDLLNLLKASAGLKRSHISDLHRKQTMLAGYVGIGFQVVAIGKFLLLGLIAMFFLGLPFVPVALFIGAEIATILVVSRLAYQQIQAMKTLDTTDNGIAYRTVLISNACFDVKRAFVGFCFSALAMALILLGWSDSLKDCCLEELQKLLFFVPGGQAYYAIGVMVFFYAAQIASYALRYYGVQSLPQTDNYAVVEKAYNVFNQKIDLFTAFPALFLLLGLFALVGFPLRFVLLLVAILLVFLALGLISIRRIQSVDLSETVPSIQPSSIATYANERIEGAVFGISTTAASFLDSFTVVGSSTLGKGKNYFPENSLLITNRRMLFIEVPMSGGDWIVDETDYAAQNFMFNRAELVQKGKALLTDKTAQELLVYTKLGIDYETIQSVLLKTYKFIVTLTSGKKVAYMFLDREYADQIEHMLAPHLKERFTRTR